MCAALLHHELASSAYGSTSHVKPLLDAWTKDGSMRRQVVELENKSTYRSKDPTYNEMPGRVGLPIEEPASGASKEIQSFSEYPNWPKISMPWLCPSGVSICTDLTEDKTDGQLIAIITGSTPLRPECLRKS